MSTVASDVMDEARSVYLNDPNGGTYSYTILMPMLKNAYSSLQTELEAHGVQCKSEEVTKVIPAGIDEYVPLPVNLVIPTKCEEREANTDDEFRPMSYYRNIPKVTAGAYLEYWTWRLDRLLFLACTQDREVKLYYQLSFPAVNTEDDSLFGRAEQYLSARLAALAHLFIAQNETLAKVANDVAETELMEIINIQVKINQIVPSRRKGYIPFRIR